MIVSLLDVSAFVRIRTHRSSANGALNRHISGPNIGFNHAVARVERTVRPTVSPRIIMRGIGWVGEVIEGDMALVPILSSTAVPTLVSPSPDTSSLPNDTFGNTCEGMVHVAGPYFALQKLVTSGRGYVDCTLVTARRGTTIRTVTTSGTARHDLKMGTSFSERSSCVGLEHGRGRSAPGDKCAVVQN